MTDRRLREVSRVNTDPIEEAFIGALSQFYAPPIAVQLAKAHLAEHPRLVKRIISPQKLDTRDIRSHLERSTVRYVSLHREPEAASEAAVREEITGLLQSTPNDFVAESVICLTMQVHGWPPSHVNNLLKRMQREGLLQMSRVNRERHYRAATL